MELKYIDAIPKSGFNYDNCLRNKALLDSNINGTN
jgi:hypothetical protein